MSGEKRVDEDWKRRAQLEKEQDAAKVAPPPPPGQASPGAAPKAGAANPNFMGLVESLATQALMFMGAVRDPMTGAVHQDMGQAQQMVDMLGMIEEKTRGNLTKEEADMLKQVLDEVRMHFVRLSSPPPPPGPKGPMMGNRPGRR